MTSASRGDGGATALLFRYSKARRKTQEMPSSSTETLRWPREVPVDQCTMIARSSAPQHPPVLEKVARACVLAYASLAIPIAFAIRSLHSGAAAEWRHPLQGAPAHCSSADCSDPAQTGLVVLARTLSSVDCLLPFSALSLLCSALPCTRPLLSHPWQHSATRRSRTSTAWARRRPTRVTSPAAGRPRSTRRSTTRQRRRRPSCARVRGRSFVPRCEASG